MPLKPQAKQQLNARFQVTRTAMCPLHNTQTSDFLGPNADAWVFRCKATDHTFAARPDPSAPKTVEAYPAWREQKLIERATAKPSKKGV